MTLGIGIHADIPPEIYHADPCPEASLSSGMIKRLLTGSPKEAAAYHPRLSQWPELPAKESTPAQDLGTLGHSLILRTPCLYQAIDPEDLAADGIRLKSGPRKGEPYTTWSGGAKDWRDDMIAKGYMIISRKEDANVRAAVESMARLLERTYQSWPTGASEQSVIWTRREKAGSIYCRARLDHFSQQHLHVLDAKLTDLSISDAALTKKVELEQWEIQAAWYLEGIEEISEAYLRGRLIFRFVVAEINPPFQSRFFDLTQTRMDIGRAKCQRAASLFAKCLHGNDWPPYAETFAPEVSEWTLRRYEEDRLMWGMS